MPERPSDIEIFRRLEAPGQRLLGSFPSLTDAQRAAIPPILQRRPVLLVARTASGKTEAVLAPLLSLAVREEWKAEPSILYLAPTRALVNDLYRRIAEALAGFVTVGRRTGEHRDPDNFLLVTTPESLDSMLARGTRGSGHLLGGVKAVVLDELHLLAESARGTQVQVLLARLDEVTGKPVLRTALSATVPAPDALARRYLGASAVVCTSAGSRPLRIVRRSGDGPLPERGDGIDPLAHDLLRTSEDDDAAEPIADALLAERKANGKLKGLVFVPTRARCDRLTARLAGSFASRCPVIVHAHHGSLDQRHREDTEEALSRAEESVAVATTTLEVGIDIGDVGVVVLDGPPGSVSSLLQRIGRGSRRSNEVRVIPFARDDVAGVTLASMLRSAVDGYLDPIPDTAHFSVAVQQLASIFFQAARARRPQGALTKLLEAAFEQRTPFIVEELLSAGAIQSFDDGRLGASPQIRELMDTPMRLHGNIGGSGSMVALVDAVTGDPIAWVPRGSASGRIVVAGAAYEAHSLGDRVELRLRDAGARGGVIRYSSRGAPISRTALRHMCSGLGLADTALVESAHGFIHFGGALMGRLMSLAGVESGPLRSVEDPRGLEHHRVLTTAEREWRSLEALCGFGPFHSDLPDSLRQLAVVETIRAHDPISWLSRLSLVRELSPEQQHILGGV